MNKHFTRILIGFLLVIFAVALMLAPKLGFAQNLREILPSYGVANTGPYPGFPTKFTSVGKIIGTIFEVAIAAAAAVFMVLLLVGGVQYLTAAGNEEATGKAKKLLVDAVIGLIITLSAWAIGTFILGRFFGFAGGIGPIGGGGGTTTTTPPSGPVNPPGTGGQLPPETITPTRNELTAWPRFNVSPDDVGSVENTCVEQGGRSDLEVSTRAADGTITKYTVHCYTR